MISVRASPVFTKTLRFDRPQIASAGPGFQRQSEVPLKETCGASSATGWPRARHSHCPQFRSESLAAAATRLLATDLAAKMQQQPRNVDLQRTNFPARTSQ